MITLIVGAGYSINLTWVSFKISTAFWKSSLDYGWERRKIGFGRKRKILVVNQVLGGNLGLCGHKVGFG